MLFQARKLFSQCFHVLHSNLLIEFSILFLAHIPLIREEKLIHIERTKLCFLNLFCTDENIQINSQNSDRLIFLCVLKNFNKNEIFYPW